MNKLDQSFDLIFVLDYWTSSESRVIFREKQHTYIYECFYDYVHFNGPGVDFYENLQTS